MAAARVADDWEAQYSVRPVAAYTHVGPEHSGYCYHRAGWTIAGRGSGRRAAAGTVRVLALEEGWRETLHGMRRRPVGAPSARWRAPMTARTAWTGRSGSTGAPATPTGGYGGGSLTWAGRGWRTWAGSCLSSSR